MKQSDDLGTVEEDTVVTEDFVEQLWNMSRHDVVAVKTVKETIRGDAEDKKYITEEAEGSEITFHGQLQTERVAFGDMRWDIAQLAIIRKMKLCLEEAGSLQRSIYELVRQLEVVRDKDSSMVVDLSLEELKDLEVRFQEEIIRASQIPHPFEQQWGGCLHQAGCTCFAEPICTSLAVLMKDVSELPTDIPSIERLLGWQHVTLQRLKAAVTWIDSPVCPVVMLEKIQLTRNTLQMIIVSKVSPMSTPTKEEEIKVDVEQALSREVEVADARRRRQREQERQTQVELAPLERIHSQSMCPTRVGEYTLVPLGVGGMMMRATVIQLAATLTTDDAEMLNGLLTRMQQERREELT